MARTSSSGWTVQCILGPTWVRVECPLALSAVITPPDVTSQILVSLPVLLLYELGVWIARLQDKRRAR